MNAWFASGFIVRELSNGNYITVANKFDTVDSAYVTIFDSNGTVLSEKKFGDVTNLNFSSLIERNGFLYFFYNKADVSTEIIKTDLDVNQISTYSNTTFIISTFPGSVIPDDDGFLAAGGTYWGVRRVPSLVRLDSLFQNEWLQFFLLSTGGTDATEALSIIKTSDNGYVFFAVNAYHLVKVDSLGNLEWTHPLLNLATIPMLNSVDGSIQISLSHLFHYKFDLAGNIIDTILIAWNLPFQDTSVQFFSSQASIMLSDTLVFLTHYFLPLNHTISVLATVNFSSVTGNPIKKEVKSNELTVYPTIIERNGSVFIRGNTQKVSSYKLVSISGRVLTKTDIAGIRDSKPLKIEIPGNLEPGIYILEVFSDKYRYTYKIIVV
jgi:hypothetical protein